MGLLDKITTTSISILTTPLHLIKQGSIIIILISTHNFKAPQLANTNLPCIISSSRHTKRRRRINTTGPK